MGLNFLQIFDRIFGWTLIIIFKPIVGVVGLLLRRDHDLSKHPKHIVVLKVKGGGSLFLAGHSLISIRKKYPDARISLIASQGVTEFGRLLSVFDTYLVISEKNIFKLFYSGIRAIIFCWRYPVDILIDLEIYSKLSGIFAVFTLARNRLGFYLNEVYFRKGIYTHLLFLNQHEGIGFFYDGIAKLLECPTLNFEESQKHIVSMLPKDQPLMLPPECCVVAPFCSELGRSRTWPITNLAGLISLILHRNKVISIFIIGGEEDKKEAERLVSTLQKNIRDRVKVECGTLSLPDLCCLLRDSLLFIGIDSGPLHLARLFGRRVVSLWGATDPRTRLRRVPGLIEGVIYGKPACSPCVHVAEQPPCGDNNRCMKSIDVELVYKLVVVILGKKEECYFCKCVEDKEIGIWLVSSRPFKYD